MAEHKDCYEELKQTDKSKTVTWGELHEMISVTRRALEREAADTARMAGEKYIVIPKVVTMLKVFNLWMEQNVFDDKEVK